MKKEELIQVFENTKSLCENVKPPISEKHTWDSFEEVVANVVVEPMDTVSALCKYLPLGKTLVLNMASSKRPGGGVANGSVAQEECLYRCSNLFEVSKDFYPIGFREYIYSKDVTFIKDKDYNVMFPVSCDVITIAAVNLNKSHIDGADIFDEEKYETTMCMKMDAIFKAARTNKCDNIILGAWGCGVFKNDPKVVAQLFCILTRMHKQYFKNIVFAVINDHNSVANNYQIFSDVVNGK
jgi:uncharacterized protein (TIGR02452 family)